METKANQAADEKDSEVTPNFRHKKKFIEEELKRKAALKVTSEHLEIVNEPHNKKGGKVRLVKVMSNGNVHRLWLGRQKQLKEYIAKWVKAGKKTMSAA